MTTLIARRVVIVGGGGHIGLPLALVLTNIGHFVTALDVNEQAVETINSGTMPFMEEGAETLLKQVLKTSRFVATTDMQVLADAEIIIICIGTPVDEHLSPVPRIFTQLLDSMKPWLNSSQLLILRSTVYPGSTKLAGAHLSDFKLDIAFCPERILQGKAIEELGTLPNIISGLTESAIKRAEEFFSDLGPVVLASVEEAEFAKLFLNTYRYIEFATTNQLYTIANDAGVDYSRVLKIMKSDYPRAAKLPGPGLTAGPCLMKDTMQLVAYSQNRFSLGVAAFFANEGLALYIAEKISIKFEIKKIKIGLLGMAFKADNDDIRSSLSYRVRKALQLAGAEVIAADQNVLYDQSLVSEKEVLSKSDLIIICAPHEQYKYFNYMDKPVVDIWNLLGQGSLI